MPYQKPKPDHPWRTNKSYLSVELKSIKKEKKKIKSVKLFLEEILESWDDVNIITSAYGREGRFNLSELSDQKVAAWLSGLLRRNYV